MMLWLTAWHPRHDACLSLPYSGPNVPRDVRTAA